MTWKPALSLLLLGAIVAAQPGAAGSDLASIDAVDSGRDAGRSPASNSDTGAGAGSAAESGAGLRR